MTKDIYPINSYATTSLVIVMFLVTDYVLYKPIVMLDAFSSIVMFLLVLEPITLFKAKVSFDTVKVMNEFLIKVNYCNSTRSYSIKFKINMITVKTMKLYR